jgi:hypothetical protein
MTKTTSKHDQRMMAAEIFRNHGDNYPKDGPVELPDNVIDEVASALILAGIPLDAVQELDEKPYWFLSHQLAGQIHWFSRRFRNSGGWKHLKQDNN